jgi:hypothetical protein
MSIAGATLAQSDRVDRSLDDYETLLDSILPRDLNGTVFAFALRLMPSFRLESQLVVRVHDDARVSAEITQVMDRSAWEALLDRLDTDRAFSIGELASTIKVQRQVIEVDLATAQRWQDSLLNASRASIDELQGRARADRRSRNGTTVVVLDGTLGELWYSQLGVDLHWGPLQVPEPGEAPDSDVPVAIARWMTEVMETARRRVRGEHPQ